MLNLLVQLLNIIKAKMRTVGRRITKTLKEIQDTNQSFITNPVINTSQWTELLEPVTWLPFPDNLFEVDDPGFDPEVQLRIGSKLRVLQNGSYRYSYVTSFQFTNGKYFFGVSGTLPSNNPIDEISYSDTTAPVGFPYTFSIFPGLVTGSLSNLSPSTIQCRWRLDGALCYIDYHFDGGTLTSSQSSIFTQLPVTPDISTASTAPLLPIVCVNNFSPRTGVAKTLGSAIAGSYDLELLILNDSGFANWSASTNGVGADLTFTYLIQT